MVDIILEVIKRPGHRLVKLQGGETLKIPTALFALNPIKSGEVLKLDEYSKQVALNEPKLALEAAVRMLELRDHSTGEITRKLRGNGYSEAVVKAACDRLQTAGYLDDLRFAQGMLARYQKKYGLLRIKRELFMKGIAADIVEEVLSQGDGDAQLDAAILQAQKTLRKKSADPQADYRRAYAALARRGYPPDMVKKALSAVLDREAEFLEDA